MTTTCSVDQRQQELGITPHQIIQAEANLLQFPFFALHTKGLAKRKGIEVTGTKEIQGEKHEFIYRVTRNTDSMYPGPLSRKVHFGLLELLFNPAKHSYPFANPIEFTWRELSLATGLRWSGGFRIEQFKEAICATHGVVITTNHALIARTKTGKKHALPKRARGYHLYEQYEFCNELGTDGDVVKRNRIWLADWYLSNLNSLYSGPLKYDVWRSLNQASPIASRIYELLQFKCRKTSLLRINYPKFCSLLPITPHVYTSRAKQQLQLVFDLLIDHEVITGVQWLSSRDGSIQLQIHAGPQLKRSYDQAVTATREPQSTDLMDHVTVREITNDETPESLLVRRFHELWSGNVNRRGFKGELAFAAELIEAHGSDRILKLMPKLVRTMKRQFPNAKTFCATRDYLPSLLVEHRKRRPHQESQPKQQAADEIRESQEQAMRQQRMKRKQSLLAIWQTLSEPELQQIKRRAIELESSQMLRTHLERKGFENPPVQFLDQLAKDRRLPQVTTIAA